ncbi:hypothetical protein, conserved [Eimeria maxima]|uniref:Uncharacterized protein n=1 Tax=Eimeria maxima TaxID=5804 RepID=U6LYN3_EIMMA|nr:hypothetical protein, conserved [Eimeria maxima]CDJ56866.1 hypothetical protein, conserved [Eimeria maxima]
MEHGLCVDDKGWRAIHGKRTEELLRQPQAACFGTPQPREVEGNGTRLPQALAADLRNPASPPTLESSSFSNEETAAPNFRISLSGPQVSLKRQIAPPGKQDFGEVLQHRFATADACSPERCKHHTGVRAPSCLHRDQHDMRGIISHSYVIGDAAVHSHRRTSHVHAAENPCRWGVDVLNYQLPEPRKLRGTGTEENLGAGLIPRQSFDEFSSAQRRMKSLTHQNYSRGHLEPSTLYPAEPSSFKFAQGKRRSKVECDNLDDGLIPSVGPDICRKRCSDQWHMHSLHIDLTPQTTPTEKTGRRPHPGWQRDSLQRGSLMPL